jgi:uncharacterized protein with HEPN domain
MSVNERDTVRLQHILQAIEFVEEFIAKADLKLFIKDYLLQSAVVRQFEIIGEAAGNTSEELKSKYPEVKWNEIKGFRNLLIHEYFRVDAIELWKTIEDDLPELKRQLKEILAGEEKI